jgi:hypothetical protein
VTEPNEKIGYQGERVKERLNYKLQTLFISQEGERGTCLVSGTKYQTQRPDEHPNAAKNKNAPYPVFWTRGGVIRPCERRERAQITRSFRSVQSADLSVAL